MILTIVILALGLLSALVAAAHYYMQARIWREKSIAAQNNDEHFKLMAREIFEQNSRDYKRESESRLSEIVTPVKENLEMFRRMFTESYSQESRERYSLQEQMRRMIETSNLLSREAHGLASALRGNNRVQGKWGEMVLENILEHCGLRRDLEFSVQTVTTAGGEDDGNVARRLRPDVVINYPDGRQLAIDAKSSLTSYFDYVDALDSADAGARDMALKAHLASVKSHINELKDKRYQDALPGPSAGFVVMFIPHEGAFLAALQAEKTLWDYAYDSHVIIVSPAHLMAIIKMVESLWYNDRQNRNALAIAEQGGKMLDKLSAFLADMEKMGGSLRSAQACLDGAMTKLQGKGGVISHGLKMKELGAKASKVLPRVVEDDSEE